MNSDVNTWALPKGAITRLGRGTVRDMAFSPDGQYLAVGTGIGLLALRITDAFPHRLVGYRTRND